jgi:hypothetical protein
MQADESNSDGESDNETQTETKPMITQGRF